MAESIGIISLNISFLIYFLYFFPQIIYNQIKCQANNISYFTQLLMITANGLDLVYGFGLKLQWQYRTVSIFSLSCLLFQQWQIHRDSKKKLFFFHLSAISISIVSLLTAVNTTLSTETLTQIGVISMLCYSIYWLPQIIKNARNKSAQGFSKLFIMLNGLALTCDEISAISLAWPLPSIISPLLLLVSLVVLINQQMTFNVSKKNPD